MKVVHNWATWMVIAYFALTVTMVGLYRVAERSDSADRRILKADQALAAENHRRSVRNCRRIQVIVEVLDREAPDAHLLEQLRKIDLAFPDVSSPCGGR